MRRRPKSKLSTYPRGGAESGMPAHQVQTIHLDTQAAQRTVETIRQRHIEYNIAVSFDGQPGVLTHLALQLTTPPAGITQRHEVFFRTLAAGYRRKDVTRSGDHDFLADGQAGLEPLQRRMQHKYTIRSNRA